MHQDSTPQAAARPARGRIAPRPLSTGFGQTTAAGRCLGGAAMKLLNALRVLAFGQDGAKWSPERMSAEAGISRSAFYYCVDELWKTPVPDYKTDPTGNTPFADGRTFLVILGKGPKRRLYPIDGRCQVTAPADSEPVDCPKFGQIPSKVWTPGATPTIGSRARILDPVQDEIPNVNVCFFGEPEPEKPKDACVVSFAESGMGKASDYAPADVADEEQLVNQGVLKPVADVDPEYTELEAMTADELKPIAADKRQCNTTRALKASVILGRRRMSDAKANSVIRPKRPVPKPTPVRPAAAAPGPVTLEALLRRVKPGASSDDIQAAAWHAATKLDDVASFPFYRKVMDAVASGAYPAAKINKAFVRAKDAEIGNRGGYFAKLCKPFPWPPGGRDRGGGGD